jgi:hypothetical protein
VFRRHVLLASSGMHARIKAKSTMPETAKPRKMPPRNRVRHTQRVPRAPDNAFCDLAARPLAPKPPFPKLAWLSSPLPRLSCHASNLLHPTTHLIS